MRQAFAAGPGVAGACLWAFEMYDGVLAGEEIDRDWNEDALTSDLMRLRRRFDPLLEGAEVSLDPDADREMATLARIHDLDERMAPAELWRALRLMLTPSAAWV